MGKNAYERGLIRAAKKAALPPRVHGVKWHERNVLEKAQRFAHVFDTTITFGKPVAAAGTMLSEAVKGLTDAYNRSKILARHE